MTFKDDELKKDPNHIFALERNIKQYMFVLNIIFACIIILLIILFAVLLPLKQEKPYLVFFSDAQTNFVKVEPANMDITCNNAFKQGFITSYIHISGFNFYKVGLSV